MPHPTMLMKLTTRCGAGAAAGLNETLLVKATEANRARSSKGCGGTPRWCLATCPTDRLGIVGEGGAPDRDDRQADSGRGVRPPARCCGTGAERRVNGPMRSGPSCAGVVPQAGTRRWRRCAPSRPAQPRRQPPASRRPRSTGCAAWQDAAGRRHGLLAGAVNDLTEGAWAVPLINAWLRATAPRPGRWACAAFRWPKPEESATCRAFR